MTIAESNRSLILGIDPGPKNSGVVVLDWDRKEVCYADNRADNYALLDILCSADGILSFSDCQFFVSRISMGVVEKIVSYGRSVGQETMNTAWWGGKFDTALRLFVGKSVAVSRPMVKLALYGSLTRKAENDLRKGVDTKLLKECMKVYFDPRGGGSDPYRGTKSQKGPLYRVRGTHAWDALAVALAGKLL